MRVSGHAGCLVTTGWTLIIVLPLAPTAWIQHTSSGYMYTRSLITSRRYYKFTVGLRFDRYGQYLFSQNYRIK
jgi:hypothetical protein